MANICLNITYTVQIYFITSNKYEKYNLLSNTILSVGRECGEICAKDTQPVEVRDTSDEYLHRISRITGGKGEV